MKPMKSLTKNLFGVRLNLRRTFLSLMAGGIVGFSTSASAFSFYEATAYADTPIGYTTTPGDVTYTYSGAVTSAVVSFTSSPIAAVSYSGTASNSLGNVQFRGGGNMTYRFEVEAQPFTNVPIDFAGLYASYQGASFSPASTSFSIQTVNSSVATYSSFQSTFLGDCGEFVCLTFATFNNTTFTSIQSDASHVEGAFAGTLDMLTGEDGKVIGQVFLYAGADINIGTAPASATSFIDPHLEINAAFLVANPGATLTITPGVGNEIPAVPEPSTYALMLTGLAVLVAGKRRRAPKARAAVLGE